MVAVGLGWENRIGPKPRNGRKRGNFVSSGNLDRPKTGLIRGQTESRKIQTAVLGKRVAHPSLGDIGWTSPYILFKYPRVPTRTDARARVRQYTLPMVTVYASYGDSIPFLWRQYRIFGGSPTDPHSSGAGGRPRPRLNFEAPTNSECPGFRIEGSPVEMRLASREFMPLARNHSIVWQCS